MSSHTLDHSPLAEPIRRSDRRKRRFSAALFAGVLALISAGVLVYSQTMSFVWDEGFHLVAAQLIDAGKIPYVDFCFPQTPLNAYFNAGLMRVFGQNWHVTQVAAALIRDRRHDSDGRFRTPPFPDTGLAARQCAVCGLHWSA